MKYNHSQIELKWQRRWEEDGASRATENPDKKKYYVLIEFPYPSGEGLHVGHVRSFTALDVVARKKRAEGHNVLYPIGWDAFGLPTENYAIKTGIQPQLVTKQNTDNFRRQLKSLGLSFDWSREINTTDPKYYKWTQWIFLQLYKHGLAYKAKIPVNWCPKDKIVLANEEVTDGACERCGTPVERREKEQWMLAITKYAERLDRDLDLVDFPDKIKTQQRNWIGKSEGAFLDFPVSHKKYKFVIFHGYKGSPDDSTNQWLKNTLEQFGHEVVMPLLPHSTNEAVTEEEDIGAAIASTSFDKNTIIIGYSLGAVVALKVLERLSSPIAGALLVGGFIDPEFKDKRRPFENTFTWEFDARKIHNAAGFIRALHDIKDTAVSHAQAERLGASLGVPIEECEANGPHFTAATEPEILRAAVPAIRVYTTRPDTLFGATYVVLAPEHPLLLRFKDRITNWEAEVLPYVVGSQQKTEIERTSEGKEKTGVELKGIRAINPANQVDIPIFVADYVLGGYGTGAIMAVPAHDDRDLQFAKKFKLPIRAVIAQVGSEGESRTPGLAEAKTQSILESGFAHLGPGFLINSDKFNGIPNEEAKAKITEFVGGKLTVQYKLRDWVFSRQRYWGEPIPMVLCEKDGWVPLPESDLPLELPPVEKYQPTDTGESPLAAIEQWVNTTCPKCGGSAKRETDVMPNWAGSSWYYLAYCISENLKSQEPISKQIESSEIQNKFKYWMPVDWYNGGMEHTTLHLLYSRFWHKFLFDIGEVPTPEPYAKRTSHGLILAGDGSKMSKSKGNVVNPDEIVERFGADSLRLYEMFMGPFEQPTQWNTDGVVGVRRFLERAYKLGQRTTNDERRNPELEALLHRTIQKVGDDIDALKMNTAMSALMILLNAIEGAPSVTKDTAAAFVRLLAPFAPHIAEELWQQLGSEDSVHEAPWPEYDPAKATTGTAHITIQINGKVRGSLDVASDIDKTALLAAARATVADKLEGRAVVREVVVPSRLVNFVTG